MAASDDFRALIRAGKLAEALTTALSESIELEIATWVSLADPYGLEQENPDSALPGHRMKTRINIVDGEINTEVGSQFVGNGPYTELREFHLNQVQASREIIQSNLLSLQKLFGLWIDMQQNNFDPSYLGLGPNSNSPQLGSGTSVSLPEKPDIAFDEQPFEPLTSPSLEEDALLETFNLDAEESTAQLPPENAFPVNLEASATLDLEPTEFTAAMPPAAASPQEIASPAADADIVASSFVSPTPTLHAVDDLSQVMEEFDSELFADSFSDEEEFLAVEPEPEVTLEQSSDFPSEVPETQTSVDPLAVIFDRDDSAIEAETPWREDANLTEAADLALESFSAVDEEAEAELLAALDEEPPISAVDEEAEAELLAALDEEPPIFDEIDEATPFPENLDEDLELGKTAEPSLAQSAIDSELLDEFDATEPVFWQEEEISASEAIANEEFPAEETARLSLTDESEIFSKLNGTEEEAFWEETPLDDPFSAGVSESLLSDDTEEAYPDELAVETDADAAFWEQTSDSENQNSDRRLAESEFSLTDTALLGELNDITDEDISSETLEVSEGFSPFDLAEPQAEMTENVVEEIPEFDTGNLESSEEDFSPFDNFTSSEITDEPEIPLTDDALLGGLDDEGYESEIDDFLTEETLEDSEELSPFELSENSETGLEEEFSPFDLAQDQPETWEESSEMTSENGLFVNESIEDSEDFSPFELSEPSEDIFAENQEELPEFAEEVESSLTDDALLDELSDTGETEEFFTSETQEDLEELSPFDLGEYQADISEETTDEVSELVDEDEFLATEGLENPEEDLSPFEGVETPGITDDLEFSLTDDEILDELDNPEELISSTDDFFDTEESETAEDLSSFETSLEADEPEPSALLSEFNDAQDEDSLWEESTTSELSVSAVTPEVDFFSDSDEPEPSALLSEFETSTTEEALWEETPQAEALGTPEESLWDETEERSPFELESLDENLDSTEESPFELESLDESLEATEESPFELESLDESLDSTEESLWEETPPAEAVDASLKTTEESLWDETEEESPFELESLDESLDSTEESPFELESLDESLGSTEESPFELESLDESLGSTEESPFELESLDESLDSTEESLWGETPQAESLDTSLGTPEESLWDETQEESPFELESLDESLDSTEESLWEETPPAEAVDASLETTEESLWDETEERSPFELESLDESLEATEESPFELESLDESLDSTEESLWQETPQAESLDTSLGTPEESLWDEATEESPFELESLHESLDSTEESPFELESLDESLEATEESPFELESLDESLDSTEESPFELESLDESLDSTEESLWEETPQAEALGTPEESLWDETEEESPFELESLDESLDSTSELPDITDEEEADLLYAFEPESETSTGIDETSFDEILLASTSAETEELPPITDEEEADILQAFEPQQEGLEPLWEETASLNEQGMISSKPFEADVWEDNLLETTSELAGASDEEEAEILKAFELDDEGKSPWDDGELTNSRLPETVILGGEPLGSIQETEEDTLWDELDPFAEMTETPQPGTTDDEEAELLQAFEPEREEMVVSDTDEPQPYAGMSLNDEDEEFLNVFEDSEELAIFEESEATQTEAISEEPEELFAGLDTEISDAAQWDQLSNANLSDTSELESSFDENAFAESSWEEEQITSEIFSAETLMDEDELLAALEGNEENLAEMDALTLEEVDTSSYDQSDPLASLLDEDLQDDDPLFGSTSDAANLSADEDPLADLFPDESLEEFDPFASLSTGEQESEDSDEMDDNPFADLGFSASDTPPPPPSSNNSNP